MVEIDIMLSKQFVFDLIKKTTFIENCFCLFDLNIATFYCFIQRLVYTKIKATILSYIKKVILIYYLNISCSKGFFFQFNKISILLLAYIINMYVISFSIENNTDKSIYIFWNFYLGQI